MTLLLFQKRYPFYHTCYCSLPSSPQSRETGISSREGGFRACKDENSLYLG